MGIFRSKSRWRFSLKYAAEIALIASIMAGTVIGAYLLLTADGAIFSKNQWPGPLIEGVGLSRRALVIGGGMGLIWSLIWSTGRLRNFCAGILCSGIFEMLMIPLKMNPVVSALICILLAALMYGIQAFSYSLQHEVRAFSKSGSEDEALYQDAVKLFGVSEYNAANQVLSQLLEHPERYSRDRFLELKLKKLITLAMLGAVEEAKTLYKLDIWLEKSIWDIMRINFDYLKGYHEVKIDFYICSYADSEIKQETVESVMRNVAHIKALDGVFGFDDIFAQGIYYYLAAQVFYMRRNEEAIELLLTGLEQRKKRGMINKLNVNPVPLSKLYDLLGDICTLENEKEKAIESYNIALQADPTAYHISQKLKALKEELKI